MAEYIERQAAIDLFYPVDPENDGSDGCTVVYKTENYTSDEIEAVISGLPAADVAPVRHGKIIETIKDGKMTRVFSCCGHDFTELTCWYMPKYCPNCGAPIADEAVEMVLKRMEEIYK